MDQPGNSKTHLLYFAYGSNMNEAQIALRCRKPRVLAVARLPDHRLDFFGHSERWDGGEESVVAAPGEAVFGVVYHVTASDSDRLDTWHGVHLDGTGPYFHFPVDVLGLDGVVYPALIYKKAELGPPQPPSVDYLDHILKGARGHGLPAEYIARLERIAARPASYPVPRKDHTDQFLLSVVSCQC